MISIELVRRREIGSQVSPGDSSAILARSNSLLECFTTAFRKSETTLTTDRVRPFGRFFHAVLCNRFAPDGVDSKALDDPQKSVKSELVSLKHSSTLLVHRARKGEGRKQCLTFTNSPNSTDAGLFRNAFDCGAGR
jgi:hypothetical protein